MTSEAKSNFIGKIIREYWDAHAGIAGAAEYALAVIALLVEEEREHD